MILLVTGLQGSGKTELLKKSAVSDSVIHLDNYITTVLYNKEHYACEMIVEDFGKEVLNNEGNVDPIKLTEVVLKAPKGREALSKILAPYIKQYLRNLMDSEEKFFVEMTSYLNDEKGFKYLFNKIILIKNTKRKEISETKIMPYVTDAASSDDIEYDELITYQGKIENAITKFNKIAKEFLKEINV